MPYNLDILPAQFIIFEFPKNSGKIDLLKFEQQVSMQSSLLFLGICIKDFPIVSQISQVGILDSKCYGPLSSDVWYKTGMIKVEEQLHFFYRDPRHWKIYWHCKRPWFICSLKARPIHLRWKKWRRITLVALQVASRYQGCKFLL